MSSTIITSAIIRKESLMLYKSNAVLSAHIDWETGNEELGGKQKIGTQINFTKPILMRPTLNNMSWNAGASAATENRVFLNIDTTLTQPLSLSESDFNLRVSSFSDKFLSPIIQQIAANLDTSALNTIINSAIGTSTVTAGLDYSNISSGAGVPNSAGYVVGDYATPISPKTVLTARQVLLDHGCPDDGKLFCVLSTSAQTLLISAQATLFSPLLEINDTYRSGVIGKYAGIKFYTSQNLPTHTNGAQGAITVTSGTLSTGWAETATLTVPALSGAINAGDMYQAATSKFVNILNGVVTTLPAQFTVVQAAAIGATSIVVSPAPIIGGAYPNTDVTLNGQVISLTGAATPGAGSAGLSGVESLIFHSKAIVGASVKLEIPGKGTGATGVLVEDKDVNGFRIRFTTGYDMLGVSGAFGGGVGTGGPGSIYRFDAMWGIKTAMPEWIVRVRSSAT